MNVKKNGLEYDATKLFRNSTHGILSTMSKIYKDYPFGSLVTYVSSRSRTVYLYLSDLAEHTENLHYQSHSCLTVYKENKNGDIQNSQRLTLVGDLCPVSMSDLEECKKRFHSILPDSKKYSEMHDFKFYQLNIISARWIGGFGKIAWLDKNNWLNQDPDWQKNENRIIDHMNKDHQNTISSSLSAQHNIKDKSAIMAFLNIDGYFVKSKNFFYFIQFPHPCFSVSEFKKTLILLAKQNKSYEL